MKKASYRPRGEFWPGGIVAQNTCFFVIAASMELLSGCAIITAYEKAVNRIRVFVVGDERLLCGPADSVGYFYLP